MESTPTSKLGISTRTYLKISPERSMFPKYSQSVASLKEAGNLFKKSIDPKMLSSVLVSTTAESSNI